jgi:hypothetical protein
MIVSFTPREGNAAASASHDFLIHGIIDTKYQIYTRKGRALSRAKERSIAPVFWSVGAELLKQQQDKPAIARKMEGQRSLLDGIGGTLMQGDHG